MPQKKVKKRKITQKKQKPASRRLWLWTLKWLIIIGLWLSFAGFIVVLYYAHDLPDISKLNHGITTPRITLLAKDGREITRIGKSYGNYTAYDDIPQHFIDALTSTEDRQFFSHYGVDPYAIIRAAYSNYRAGRVVQGGSTITQQLAKNIFLSPERTLKRKIQEVLLAFYLEQNFSKEDILTIYLNRIYLGSGNYGIDAAAHSYFNKKVKDLSLYESAIIAGLIKAPSRYTPLQHPERSAKRAEQVLINMVANGVLEEDAILSGAFPNLGLVQHTQKNTAPTSYFNQWIYAQLGDYIGTVYSDITVTTTLDLDLQQRATKTLKHYISTHQDSNHVSQGATVTLSPKGDILAMVGGVDFTESQFNRTTQALRQPGSAFKLFVYLTALQHGYGTENPWRDEPITLDQWSPSNWDNRYQGDVTQTQALADSINTVAVKIAQKVGIKNIIHTAYDLGITSKIEPNLTSALGTSEVSLLELTTAYAHIANNGQTVWPHGIYKITNDFDGSTLYEREINQGTTIIDSKVTSDMNHMLRSVVTSGTGKRANFSRNLAGKTGTSQNSRDAWFIGYSSNYVTGVWVGNDDNSPMHNVGGGGLPALIWRDIMQPLHHDIQDHHTTFEDSPRVPFWRRLWH